MIGVALTMRGRWLTRVLLWQGTRISPRTNKDELGLGFRRRPSVRVGGTRAGVGVSSVAVKLAPFLSRHPFASTRCCCGSNHRSITMVLSQKESDVQMLLAADAHLGTKNCDFQMERYVWKRRSDGMFSVLFVVCFVADLPVPFYLPR